MTVKLKQKISELQKDFTENPEKAVLNKGVPVKLSQTLATNVYDSDATKHSANAKDTEQTTRVA